MIKDKRKHIRVPLLDKSLMISSSAHPGQLLNVVDVSSEGLFIEAEELPKPLDEITLEIAMPGDLGVFSLRVVVARVTWATTKKNKQKKGFGVKTFATDNQQRIWDAFVIYQRNKHIISVSKRIIEEFFGPKGP